MAREQNWASSTQHAKAKEERALAAEKDRIVRNNSVANDIRLNLPVSVPMPDGEEHFSRPSPRLLPYDTRSEIQRPYIKPPPNKAVCCTPDWDDSSSLCSCGPVSQSVPKSGSSGHHSGWSLSGWSRSSKSPPSHSRHRCQRHSHPSNSSTSRHTSNSSSKQKNVLGPQAVSVGGFLIGSSCCSSSEKTHNSVQYKGTSSGPSIKERLTEKVHHCTSAVVGNTRTSPNNISTSGVLARLIDEPIFSSSSSKGSKRSGKCTTKSSRYEPSLDGAQLPSENVAAIGESRSTVKEDVQFPGCSSEVTHHLEKVPIPMSFSPVNTPSSRGSGSESIIEIRNETRRHNDFSDKNVRVPPVIGRHGDKLEGLSEERFSMGGCLHRNFPEGRDSGSYSKNLSSTTDSSLYHLNMHPRVGSALSESIKETAHSELSDTHKQLSDQYCSAEIASTSSVCSSGQSKDVRSLIRRDVT